MKAVTVPDMRISQPFDVIVVGGGHAGCEAALAAARMGQRTLLVTMNLDLLAQMPCNPSVGGSAKGQLVREIDALGGAMGRVIDRTFIQVRMLNLSKGPAVRALRAQADKRLYSLCMKNLIEATPNLALKQGAVERLLTEGDRITGVRLARGEIFAGRSVVIAGGTFLAGRILSGEYATPAGRAGEFPAIGLSASLRELGFELRRLQTNTPPRVDARTIHFDRSAPQPGHPTPLYFSFDGPPDHIYQLPINPLYPIAEQTAWRPQIPCYLVHSNERTQRIVLDNMHRSPIAPGTIDAAGPRYCPSFEEKVVRFPNKASHQFFLEPEGWATGEVYVQGCFTGMPADVQAQMLHSIPALADAEIMRPGYAIEYDGVPSHQIKPSLETRRIHGLFLTGQINGTSGYEEAAAQGLLAGANAARYVQDASPLVLGRDQAYMGVLVDDLITKEIIEPYRMMTSRAEYRLLLRGDNADLRLSEVGHAFGLVDDARWQRTRAKQEAVTRELARLEEVRLRPSSEVNALLGAHELTLIDQPISAAQVLRRPGAGYALLIALGVGQEGLDPEVAEQVEIACSYQGYIAKQTRQIARARRLENHPLPEDLDYTQLSGLRTEAREQLERFRPATLGQASRIVGVNPADISVLLGAARASSLC